MAERKSGDPHRNDGVDTEENSVPQAKRCRKQAAHVGAEKKFGDSCKKNRLGYVHHVMCGLDEEVDPLLDRCMGIDSPAPYN